MAIPAGRVAMARARSDMATPAGPIERNRMAKVVIIGAGSGFGGKLSIDILSREPLRDATIALCDINATALEQVAGYVERTIEAHGLPA